MKKKLLLLVAVIATAVSVNAQYYTGSTTKSMSSFGSYGVNTNSTYVNGYTKSDGTYVNGYYRSSRNGTNHDNYSVTGNPNPYTGKSGSVAKDYSAEAYSYGSGKTIHTGSRGGQYYINSKGNKTYVPKRK